MKPKSVIRQDFGHSGQYDAGLQSLVRSMQLAFTLLLVVIIAMMIYFITGGGYFSVEPQRAVIVLRFGKIINEPYTTGGHWFFPYPVHKFVHIQTNQQLLDVNFVAAELPEGGEPAAELEPGRDGYLLTGDANIIHASWTVAYRVANPQACYTSLLTPVDPVLNDRIMPDETFTDANGFKGARGPQTLVRNLFRQAVIQVTAGFQAADLLSTKLGPYREEVARRFTTLMTEANCGIEVENVTLNRAFPPSKTKAAFDAVAAAGNTHNALISGAEEYRVKTANETLAHATRIKAEADTYRIQAVASIKAESTYFESIEAEYRKSPKTVLMALYNSALAEVLGDQENVFILGSGAGKDGHKQLRMKLNPEPKRSETKTAEEK